MCMTTIQHAADTMIKCFSIKRNQLISNLILNFILRGSLHQANNTINIPLADMCGPTS